MRTCLVVDDSRVIRKVARRIIEDLDFTCAEAADGMEALERCRAAMPDAILLDWNMPVMNGLQFLHELRGAHDGERPIVIFCTAENGLDKINEALSAGANEYVMKPFDGDILQSKFAAAGLA